MDIRTVEHDSFTSYYVTAAEPDAARRLPVQWMQEKMYGLPSARAAALRARGKADGVTYVECQPAGGGDFAGVQLWGVTSDVRPVKGGRLWETKGTRLLYLPGITGGRGRAPQQARRMFRNAEAVARANGFDYGETVRTWIYMKRILDWYGEFNHVRGDFYANQKFRSGAFPASTGIQGAKMSAECLMDVLLVESKSKPKPIHRSARQGRASSYGSAFSRGMTVPIEGRKTIHVSGTASIDGEGRTLFVGDLEGQCRQTLASVAALLEGQGAALRNIVSATVFCKTPDARPAFRRELERLGVDLPAIYVIADVCRPELLVEMEAVACV